MPLRKSPHHGDRAGLKDGMAFRVEVIDTSAMTITPVDGVFVVKQIDRTFQEKDGRSIPLPGKPWIAPRLRAA